MISDMRSVAVAVSEVNKGWKEWEQRPDGFMLYMDFRFANQMLLDEFQRFADMDADRQVFYGPSYGPFPKTVRVYYPLYHETYPIHRYQPCEEELWVTAARNYKESRQRYKPEPPEEDEDEEIDEDEDSEYTPE